MPDISLNAVANLGYAECRFHRPVHPGDTLRTRSEVIGLMQNSNGRTGVVWVRSTATNQDDDVVLDWARWVMVHKRDADAPAPDTVVPELAVAVRPGDLPVPDGLDFSAYDFAAAGEPHRFDDYEVGEKIDHVDGVTLSEAEHMMATRLWQNTAKVHFNTEARPDGKRLIYGGHVISMARALAFNGLANAQLVAAINAGSHVAPAFAGDTVYAWSEVLDKAETSAPGVGALRLRLVATKGRDESMTLRTEEGKYADGVLLDLDHWVLPGSSACSPTTATRARRGRRPVPRCAPVALPRVAGPARRRPRRSVRCGARRLVDAGGRGVSPRRAGHRVAREPRPPVPGKTWSGWWTTWRRDRRVVLTARDLARQLPAVWQERVKNRARQVGGLLDDVDASWRARDWDAPFWRTQHLGRLAQRFAGLSLTVVTVPPRGSDPALLWRRFAAACGLPAAHPDLSVGHGNASMGRLETEASARSTRGWIPDPVATPRAPDQERAGAQPARGARRRRTDRRTSREPWTGGGVRRHAARRPRRG